MNPTAHDVWAAAYVPPAPDRVPCKGVDPAYFDLALNGEHLINTLSSVRRITYAFQTQVGVALSYCAQCPLATREWCVETVRPRESRANVVAGGVCWVNGRGVWDIAAQEHYEAVAS